VDLTLDEGNIILTVQDNGHGFQPAGTTLKGIGLSSMRERVTIAGGHFAISSMQKRGTIITAQFPLHPHQNKMEELS
jgi:signal transduction histidine kinase